jgi:hypothetical protein
MADPILEERAGVLHLVIEQGATFNPVFTWQNQDASPIDLTSWTARMHIRDTSDALVHELTTENGGIALGGVAGTIALNISAADTAVFSFKDGKYDLELESPGGEVRRLLRGDVGLSTEVTK